MKLPRIELVGAAVSVSLCLLLAVWSFHDAQAQRKNAAAERSKAWQDGYLKGANEALETVLTQAEAAKSHPADVSALDQVLHERLRDGLKRNPYQ